MEQTKVPFNLELVRTALQRDFIERCKRNSAYSLRAYAKFLEIDQSFLSKILKQKRAITPDFAETVVRKLALRNSDIVTAAIPQGTKTSMMSLSDDEFELLSEWHHFAIIELSKTEGFINEPHSIAHRLGIHVEEVRDALARLERLGFIKILNNKFQVLSPNTTWSNTKKTSDARKRFQRSLLEKSLDALDHIPFEMRENGSVTVAINKSRLPEFKEKMKQMRQELAQFFQSEKEAELDEVYQLTMAFFPLTKSK